MKFLATLLFLLFGFTVLGQDVIPMAKTKEQRKAARKNMTLEQKIEDISPIDIDVPSFSVSAPGGNNISSVEDAQKYVNETLPGYGNKEKKKKSKKAKKEAKAKEFNGKSFEGIEVEKQIYRRGSGSRMKYIEFYTLKNYQQTNPYIRSLHWYDDKTGRIVEAVARDRKNNFLMHGPYKEYVGENLVKEGFYYLGTMHGRWETYDKEFTLVDKVSYQKGFLADSKITYYDEGQQKIKEVTPQLYGKKSGDFYAYYEGGTLAQEGQYDNGVKVGRWVEYYDSGNRRKMETQFPKDCYDESEPILLREYAEDGKMTYEHESLKRM